MAGEIQLNSTTMATESSGSITAELDTIKPNTNNGSLTLQGDSSGSGVTGITIDSSGNTTLGGNLVIPNSGTIGSASDTDAITIDSSGNLLVGKTAADSGASVGFEFNPNGYAFCTRASAEPLIVNRTTNDGTLIQFRKNGSTVGYIGTGNSGDLYIGNEDTGLMFAGGSNAIMPTNGTTLIDNFIDLGEASFRFDDVYATNGTIQTSDRNEKQDIEELSEAEQRVAVAAKGLLRKYRWKSAVAKKGDQARIHFGIIAQDLKAAFEAEGLDAGRYGMFIHSEWWETEETYTDDNGAEKTRINTFDTEEDAPEGAVKKDRMGIRYSELLAFIIAAI